MSSIHSNGNFNAQDLAAPLATLSSARVTSSVGSDFGVRSRYGKYDLKSDTEEKVKGLFEQFKQQILENQNLLTGKEASDFKVNISLSTRLITILDTTTGNMHHVDLNALDPDRDVNRMRRLVQNMQNDLIFASVIGKASAPAHSGQEGYDPNILGASHGTNAIVATLSRTGDITQERMQTEVRFTDEERDLLLGSNPGNEAAYLQLNTHVQNEASAKLNTLKSQKIYLEERKEGAIHSGASALERNTLNTQIAKLTRDIAEISVYENKGMIQLTTMIRARADAELAELSQDGNSPEHLGRLQEKAHEYTKDLKLYFQLQRASEQMGGLTETEPAQEKADNELAEFIVATALFARHKPSENAHHKGAYQQFVFALGHERTTHLGKFGKLFQEIDQPNTPQHPPQCAHQRYLEEHAEIAAYNEADDGDLVHPYAGEFNISPDDEREWRDAYAARQMVADRDDYDREDSYAVVLEMQNLRADGSAQDVRLPGGPERDSRVDDFNAQLNRGDARLGAALAGMPGIPRSREDAAEGNAKPPPSWLFGSDDSARVGVSVEGLGPYEEVLEI